MHSPRWSSSKISIHYAIGLAFFADRFLNNSVRRQKAIVPGGYPNEPMSRPSRRGGSGGVRGCWSGRSGQTDGEVDQGRRDQGRGVEGLRLYLLGRPEKLDEPDHADQRVSLMSITNSLVRGGMTRLKACGTMM